MRRRYTLAAFALVWLAPLAQALASPPDSPNHGGGHEVEHQGIKWLGDGFLGGPGEDGRTGFLIILINFTVLMLLLDRILFRKLRRDNAEKSDRIRLELERATKARTDAEVLMREYETKLTALELEVTSIRAAATASAEAERAHILSEAERAAEEIKRGAMRAAERESAKYRAELEREIATQALDRAEAAIRSTISSVDQKRLLDAWLADVGGSKVAGGPQ